MRLGFLVLLGVMLISFVSAAIPDNCDSSMVAYWKMDGDATDSRGDHHGVWTGTEEYGSLVVNDGAKFLGSNKITITNAPKLSLDSAFTIEMWIEKDTKVSDGFLFNKGAYEIEYVSDGFLQGHILVSAGGVSVSSGNIGNGIYHIALTWDPNNNPYYLTLYVNGEEEDKVSMPSPANDAANLFIGDGFTGLIDEVAFYGDDLSASKIKSHFNLGDAGRDYCDVSGTGGSSSTDTSFTIAGCNFDIGDGETFGVAKDSCSVAPNDGKFFCDKNQVGYKTEEEGLGCAMGNKKYESNSGLPFCCPPGSYCNDSKGDDNKYICSRRNLNCSSFDGDEGGCKENGCIWLDITGECVDMPRDYSCSYYNTNETCEEDYWNLGKTGIGTDRCGSSIVCNNGKIYSIPLEECKCVWYDDDEVPSGIANCQLDRVGAQMFYDKLENQDRFKCSGAFKLEKCIDGVQNVTVFSTNKTLNGFNSTNGIVPEDCLEEMGCITGSDTRFCGEPIIKVPGFDFSSSVAVSIIVAFYFIFENRKQKIGIYLAKFLKNSNLKS